VVTDPIIGAVTRLTEQDQGGAVATVIAGEGLGSKAVMDGRGMVIAGTIPESLADAVATDARALLAREQSVTLSYGGSEVFFEMLAPRPRLFVFGAVHIAQELVQHAGLLGFRTVVADPRPAFVTKERFPGADELRVGWPGEVCDPSSFDERTFVVILTHDRRFEDPLWPIVLPSPARYLGAMGSAKTTAARRRRLLDVGFTEEQVDRIHGPIGIDIGSRTAGETAIAILAEMIGVRYLHDEPAVLIGQPLRA
jgi:xanthine dehydrogenase accessory factor